MGFARTQITTDDSETNTQSQQTQTTREGQPTQGQARAPIEVPFVGMPTQRATGTGDQRYINVVFESEKNPITKARMIYVRKRPGTTAVNQPPAGAAAGRGCYAWPATGELYSVFANKIYHGTTDMGVTLAGSTGKVWFASTPATSTTQYLIVSDGADMYIIETNNTITQIDETDDPQWPTANLGPVCFFDDYIFLAQADGEIWNSDVDAPTAWTSTGLISAAGYGDDLEVIVRMKEQLVAFGKSSIQMFYDNATTGSPLARVEENIFQVGLSSKATLAQSGETVVWVGSAEESGDMNRQVWLMEGLTKFKTVSTNVINRFLAAEGSSISSATCFMERIDGHLLYVLNLAGANRTFVYDVDMDMWCEWQVANGTTKITWGAATSLNGIVYVQDVASGYILKFDPTKYQDATVNFTVTIQTDRYNFGAPLRKFQTALWVEGDTATSAANLAVAVTDDDYITFSTARNIDMTSARKYLPTWGAFYTRAYKFTFTANLPLRLKSFYVHLEPGDM